MPKEQGAITNRATANEKTTNPITPIAFGTYLKKNE